MNKFTEMIKILSMTGCGYARIQGETSIITAEIKSVNSRYLDLNCKMPRAYSRVEEKVKALAGTYATRGKIDIYISAEPVPGASDSFISLDDFIITERVLFVNSILKVNYLTIAARSKKGLDYSYPR